MDFPRGARMVPSEDSRVSAPSDLEPPLDSGFNEYQTPELVQDARLSSQHWKFPLGIVENPAAGNSGNDFIPNSQWEMPQSGLCTPIGDANMSLDPELPSTEGQGFLFGPNEENLAILKSRVGSETPTIEGQMMAPFGFSMKGTTGMEALPPGPTPIPASFISRPNRPRVSNVRANRPVISRRSNTMLGRDNKLQQIPPIRLIKHLENEFRSNGNISDDFRHSAMVCLARLNTSVRHEKQHGSPAARKFLSGEDDRTNRLSFFDSSENSSPSLTQPMNTLIFNPSLMIYSDNTSDDTSALISVTEEPSTHCIVSTSKTIYYCTYPGCVQQCKTRADWMRHEKTKQHWMQDRYMCSRCVITEISPQYLFCTFCSQPLLSMEDAKSHCLTCLEAKSSGKTFPRKDKFGQHLRAVHGIPKIPEEMESWIYSVDGNWPRQCGFCGKHFEDWEERANDIEAHFKAGKTMVDYILPFPFPTDSAMQYSDSYPGRDNDDDDYGGGGDGWDQTQGSGPPAPGFSSGWPGSHSASMGNTQPQNEASGTNNETQYSRPSTVVTTSTDLISYKSQILSPSTNLIREPSPIPRTIKSSYHSRSSTKTLENLLPVINTHHLLISALSTLSALPHHILHQKKQHNLHASQPKLMKSLIPFLLQQARHDAVFLFTLDPTHRTLASLLTGENLGIIEAESRWAVRGGRKHRRRRQKSWERKWNGGDLEKEFERVLVLRGEWGRVGI